MAITFLEKRKRLRYLFPVLATVVLITALVIWRGFLAKEKPQTTPAASEQPVKKIEIDLKTLKNPLLDEFQPFEKIEPFKEKIGRQNPFIHY